MKKIIAMVLVLSATTTTALCFNAEGFQDNNTNMPTTVTEALKMHDNSYVTLKGTILKRLSNDKYLFKDKTGTMTIEIDNDKWLGQTVKPNEMIEITGEVERDFNSVKIDVKTVKKVNK